MVLNKKLYKVLSSKGQDEGVVRGFRVPKEFPLKNMELKLIVANVDLIIKNEADAEVKPILTKLTKFLTIRRKEMEKKKENDD